MSKTEEVGMREVKTNQVVGEGANTKERENDNEERKRSSTGSVFTWVQSYWVFLVLLVLCFVILVASAANGENATRPLTWVTTILSVYIIGGKIARGNHGIDQQS